MPKAPAGCRICHYLYDLYQRNASHSSQDAVFEVNYDLLHACLEAVQILTGP